MSYNTVIQQGRFTSDATARTLQLRADIDWMRVWNETVLIAGGATTGAEYYWQRGMAAGRGVIYTKTTATDALAIGQIAANGGFLLVDSSNNPVGAAVATTDATNAVQPVIDTGDTTGMADGTVVRGASFATAPNLCGFDFEIDTIVANTSFRVRTALANAPGAVAGAGTYRIVNADSQFYPRRRFVVDITSAAAAVVHVSVAHNYTVGQVVRMVVPAAFAMTQMDGLTGTITAVTARTFTLNINSTAFTAFAFPLVAAVPFSWAEVVPFGEDTAAALAAGADILGGATLDSGYIGMILAAGTASPAGDTNDVIYWQAGKAFSVDND